MFRIAVLPRLTNFNHADGSAGRYCAATWAAAAYWRYGGKSVKVLVDDFPQLHADQSIYVTIFDRKPLPVRPSTIPNLDIVPSHILLSNTDVKLTTAIDPLEARLKTQLDAIRDRYEHVIIDCPPARSWLTWAAEGAQRLHRLG